MEMFAWSIPVLMCVSLGAQSSHPVFRHLTTDNGLSSNKVEAILQDREGFYWVATQNGLNRFDGTSFKVFRHDPTDTTSLSHNYCTSLLEDKNGDIWVSTYKGVSRFIRSKGCFQRFYLHHPGQSFEVTNRIFCIAADPDSNVWVGGGGLWRYDYGSEKFQGFLHDSSDVTSIPRHHDITEIEPDHQNKGIWFVARKGLGFYSVESGSFYHAKNNPLDWSIFKLDDTHKPLMDDQGRLWFLDLAIQKLCSFDASSNQITITSKDLKYGLRHLAIDDQNRIWFLYWVARTDIFDPATQKTDTAFCSALNRNSLLSERVAALYVDRDRNYWIGTGNGLSIYHEQNQYYKLHHLVAERRGHEKEVLFIRAIAQTSREVIWLGTNIGLYQYNLTTHAFRRYEMDDENFMVNSLCATGNNLWIGTNYGLWRMDLLSEHVIQESELRIGTFFILTGNSDDLWLGSWARGLHNYDISTRKLTSYRHSLDAINCIRSNSLVSGLNDGAHLWVGYNVEHGFSSFEFTTGAWNHFQPPSPDKVSVVNTAPVTAITKDLAGHLWLGSYGTGVFKFDPVQLTYEYYQQHHGLSSNYINSILPDAAGNLWISTADGINYFNSTKKTIRSLDIGFIFPHNDFMGNGCAGVDGKLYFYCNDEFVEIDPSKYHIPADTPKLVVSSFKIFDKEQPFDFTRKEIRLSYQENFFSFVFSAIRPHPAQEVSYAYRLDGFDKDWILTGNQNFANYTNVPDGKYLFQVKATNGEGLWSDALLNIPISIKPPFWRTWWFVSLCLLVAVSLIYGIHQYRITHIKKIFSLRTRISQDLHDDIGGSLSSIYIYSTVAEREMDAHPHKAREFLRQIHANSREVMENIGDIVWANRTDKHEKYTLSDRIKNYGYDLLPQKNIECKYSIDAHVERKLTSPEARRNVLLIIKEGLNNMAKYSDASHAEVNVKMDRHFLHLDITDNGRGFELNGHQQGNGLDNMKHRASSLGGELTITSANGKGTSVQCKIPVSSISD